MSYVTPSPSSATPQEPKAACPTCAANSMCTTEAMHACKAGASSLELGLVLQDELRHRILAHGIRERCGVAEPGGPGRISCRLVIEQAAQRFFHLAWSAEAGLKGRFSAEEFHLLLNSECYPVWEWLSMGSLVAQVAGRYGVENLDALPADSPLRVLLFKLLALSPLESATLVDACEQAWRGHKNPLL